MLGVGGGGSKNWLKVSRSQFRSGRRPILDDW
jgi:hypothetical protein